MKNTRWIAVAGITLGTVANGQTTPDPPLYTQDVIGTLVSLISFSKEVDSTCTVAALAIADDVTFDTTVRVTSLTWWGSAIVCGSPFTVSRFDGVTKIIVEFYATGPDASGFDAPTGTPQTFEFIPGISIEELPPAGLTEGDAGFENRVIFSTPVEIQASEKTWISIVAVTSEFYLWATQGTGTDSPDFGTDGAKSKAINNGTVWTAVDAVFGGQAFSLEGFEAVSVDSDNDGLDDATEIALKSTLTCLDINNPDSDGDGLFDGFEVNIVGTNPCKVDTDGDGIPDILDLDSSTLEDPSEQALFAQFVADEISLADLPKFSGPNDNAKSARQKVLTSRMDEAASLISQEMYAEALEVLFSVLARVDADQSPPDWIIDENERAFVEELVLFTIGLIS
ncbi:MAG: hypothetical protein IID31_05300 [Planctomycetes bacterium]|nr:hypothetical protein [Planctomycetota bacterium]